jgi:hypothetical protein
VGRPNFVPAALISPGPTKRLALGGILGALALRWVLGGTAAGLGATTLASGLPVGNTTITIAPAVGFVLEAILTFFLVNAVMNAGISGKATIPRGLAIGLTLTFYILHPDGRPADRHQPEPGPQHRTRRGHGQLLEPLALPRPRRRRHRRRSSLPLLL